MTIANQMAKKVTVTLLIGRVWDIDGFPNYFFGDDKQLYRFDSRGAVKTNKRVIIGTTQGHILKKILQPGATSPYAPSAWCYNSSIGAPTKWIGIRHLSTRAKQHP